MIVVALHCICIKLIWFVRLFFVHITSVTRTLVFILSFRVLKEFLREIHSYSLLLIGLLGIFLTTFFLLQVKNVLQMTINPLYTLVLHF